MAERMSLKKIRELPNGLHKVEKGLFIYVRPNSRLWQFWFSYKGKQQKMSLGSALVVPFEIAREKKNRAQALLLMGKNPLEERKKEEQAEKQAQKTAQKDNKKILFKDWYITILERIKEVKQWRNAKSASQWKNTIDTYALPILGEIPVKDITRDKILSVLTPIWKEKTETAFRLRGRLEVVLGYAITEGLIQGGNPALWKHNLDQFLPARGKVKKKTHFESTPHAELKERISTFKPNYISHALILFTILTACRIGESAPAKWEEFDFEQAIWYIPPERRKDGKSEPFRVPLSKQVIEILNIFPKISEFVFPSTRAKTPHISKETPRVLIQRYFKNNDTAHGMRSTFRGWCAENEINFEVAEKCLMHAVGNEVSQSYQRSDQLEQRRVVMQKWADYLLGEEWTVRP